MERRREGERDRKKERKGEGYIERERDIVRWTEGREIEGGIRREKYEREMTEIDDREKERDERERGGGIEKGR